MNDYSLTANLGHLRYTLNPMSHQRGFLNGYQAAPPPQLNVYYGYDPGLEIYRPIYGDNWLLEAKVTFYLPCANGRSFDIYVYFGPGSTGTTAAGWVRHRDTNCVSWGGNSLSASVVSQPGTTAGDLVYEGAGESLPIGDPLFSTYYLRLERAEGLLTWSRSTDGTSWAVLFSKDFGTALGGLDQRVTIVGHSWFVPAGSYADYDYISVTPTELTVDIDIKPRSDPNSINCNNANGTVPVAILSTDDFDATAVDHTTVRFGKTGAEAAEIHKKNGVRKRHEEDVDGDGDTDIVFHFRFGDTGIECGDQEAKLTGKTFGGQAIEGGDAINTVGNAKPMLAREIPADIPEGFALYQNYPNPFNPETEIRFQLPEASYVLLKILNTLGEEIRTLVDAEYEPGYHRVRWDGKDKNSKPVASGVYLYQLQVVDPVNGGTGSFTQVKKMSLLR